MPAKMQSPAGKRGPGRPSAAAMALPGAAAGASARVHLQTLNAGDLMSRLGRWRDSLNPLRGLTPQGVTRLIEDAQRGAQSDLQWLYKWIEEEDAILGALVERSLGALSGLDWDVLIPEHLEGAELALAEAQQRTLKDFYNSLGGLREAIEEMGMARFRGCAFLEKVVVDGEGRLEPVPPEYFVRDGRAAPWCYNAAASSGAVSGAPLERERWVLREFARPVGRKAARLYVIKNLSVKDWQGYAEVFGIPAIFAMMPEGITPEERDKFQAIANQIVSEARGALPHGSDIKTVEAKNTGNSPFKELADWCDAQLVIAGTGGLLTMLSAPGSGTLAGSAHQEAFDIIARREAVKISEIFQDQLDKPLLEARFPGAKRLAYWQLSAAEEMDPDKVVEHASKLKTAGYKMSIEQLKEKTGYELEETATAEPPPPLPPGADPQPPPDKTPAADPDPEKEGDAKPEPEPEPDKLPLKNRAPEPAAPAPGTAPADPLQAVRRKIAAAINEDFEGLRTLGERLLAMDPASPDYAAGLAQARHMVTLLASAEPGSLRQDAAWAEFAAEALLEGWSLPEAEAGTGTLTTTTITTSKEA